MRILLKIVLFPLIAVLFIGSLILRFLTGIGGFILNIIGGLIFFIALISVIIGLAGFKEMIPFFILAFLCSEFGLFAFANFLLDSIDSITMKLMGI